MKAIRGEYLQSDTQWKYRLVSGRPTSTNQAQPQQTSSSAREKR